MQSAKMDRQISIIRRDQSQNEYGEIIYTDVLVTSVWANVTPIGGRKTYMASQLVPEAKFKILIRYRADVNPSYKIIFESVEYDIAYVAEIGRKEGLEILVKFP